VTTVKFHLLHDGWSDRLEHLAHPERTAEDVLKPPMEEAFRDTQTTVHVITGALKASGKLDTDFLDDEFRGTITYGGGSVDYAEYEQRRGGTHDFMANVHLHKDQIASAIREWFGA
jgi:hypothetical protein